ncbi:MAG: M20/M25/M40 family metallo-hydrolase [Candidatus Binataceae bacterium]|jgi:acetylornithine deacetylase/succinyl-diaminopimelate desuccinylase-like protein
MKVPWQRVEQEAIDSLRALIRLDTSNPPGNERLATDYISSALGPCGIQPVVVESAPNRANLVARIEGADTALRPLMLSAHTDVVPVEADQWRLPPFSAAIVDGCVWGRGALDMKSKAAMDLAIVAALGRTGSIPERSLILAAVADEEAGSELGAKFMVERHPDLVRAGYVLNEVGGFTMFFGERKFYPIQVAEKGFVTLRMTTRGQPGHGSIPRSDSAIAQMGDLISKLAHTPMRRRMTPLMGHLFDRLGLSPDADIPLFRAMLSNTVVPTILQAGYKDNVIPGEAWAVLDGRTLPGQDEESFIAELRLIVGPEPELEVLRSGPPVEASTRTSLFELIARRTESADPGAEIIPWMIPGATDNKFYAQLGAICYGFAPVRLQRDTAFGSLYHGNDERMPIDGFLWGLRLYARIVLTFLGLRFEDVFE